MTIKTRLDSALNRPLENIPDTGSPISRVSGEKFKYKLQKAVLKVRDITYFASLLGNFHILRLLKENQKLPKLDYQFYDQCFRTLCGDKYQKKASGNLRNLILSYIEFRNGKNITFWERHEMKRGIQETFDAHFSQFAHFQRLKEELKTLDCKNLAQLLKYNAQSLATTLSNHVQENYDKLITRYNLLFYY